MPGAKKRKPETVETTLKLVRLRARGRTTAEMAREVGIAPKMVLYYLNRADEDATEARPESEVNVHRNKVWAELREVKDEAWKAWEGSKYRVEFDADGNKMVIESSPDPRYLGVVVQAVADERKLYGLDVPVVKELNVKGQVDIISILAQIPGAVPDDIERDIFQLPALNEVTSNDTPEPTPPPSDPAHNGDARHAQRNGKHR